MQFQNRVQRQEIRKDSYRGTLFSPESQETLPGVVLLPGSEGGIPESIAAKIASFGFVTLALGYFGLEGLPSNLENIPLEYFQNAIEDFKKMPQIRENATAIIGYSRGGELVLLLGCFFPKLADALIAFAPSSLVCGGFPHPNRPAWLFDERPISPFLSGLMSQEETLTEAEDLKLACEQGVIPFHKNTAEDPYHVLDLFLARHETQKATPIPVERISRPLLVISGEQDRIWPSSIYAQEIMNRLDEKKSKIERESILYRSAGHGILSPYEGSIYHPIGNFWCTLGGTPEGNKEATENAWQEVIKFLEFFKKS